MKTLAQGLLLMVAGLFIWGLISNATTEVAAKVDEALEPEPVVHDYRVVNTIGAVDFTSDKADVIQIAQPVRWYKSDELYLLKFVVIDEPWMYILGLNDEDWEEMSPAVDIESKFRHWLEVDIDGEDVHVMMEVYPSDMEGVDEETVEGIWYIDNCDTITEQNIQDSAIFQALEDYNESHRNG